MNSWNQYGRELAVKSYRQGKDIVDVGSMLGKMACSDSGRAAFSGFLSVATLAVAQFKAAGVHFGKFDHWLGNDANMMMLKWEAISVANDKKSMDDFANAVIVAFESIRQVAGAKLKFNLMRSETAADPKPLEVAIVAMPSRESIVAVTRDSKGDMTGSITTEHDA